MDKKERVQIFIDGGNLYHLVFKKLNIKELDFSFEKFSDFFVRSFLENSSVIDTNI